MAGKIKCRDCPGERAMSGRMVKTHQRQGGNMKLPEYITVAEVSRVCKELGIRDWTKLKKPTITRRESDIVLKHVNTRKMKLDPAQFHAGLEVELEHGTMFKEYNVTNNHPILTGRIVMAHFMEMLDYYRRLEVAELEGDLMKALMAKNMDKARKYGKRIAKAKVELAQDEASRL